MISEARFAASEYPIAGALPLLNHEFMYPLQLARIGPGYRRTVLAGIVELTRDNKHERSPARETALPPIQFSGFPAHFERFPTEEGYQLSLAIAILS
jgi:hypothetical protein